MAGTPTVISVRSPTIWDFRWPSGARRSVGQISVSDANPSRKFRSFGFGSAVWPIGVRHPAGAPRQ
eukprot:11189621-Lingulodinium_polyedra.AAC.1